MLVDRLESIDSCAHDTYNTIEPDVRILVKVSTCTFISYSENYEQLENEDGA